MIGFISLGVAAWWARSGEDADGVQDPATGIGLLQEITKRLPKNKHTNETASTGAVVAAGELVGPVARDVAASVKLIQNVMIGFISLGVATWWARSGEDADGGQVPATGLGLLQEIWKRLPKFILGFVAASAVFTLLASTGTEARQEGIAAMLSGPVKMMRSWCFCLAFVSIGLETDIRKLASVMGLSLIHI